MIDKGRYSKVSRRMWTDARFRRLSAPPPNGQTLWQRLLTGPELTNIPGVFMAGEAGLAEALGWSIEGFREAFAEVFREGLAKADWRARFVFVPKAIHHNRPESPNVVRSWRLAWNELPECQLKTEAYRELKGFVEALGEGYAKAFAEACANPSPNQEQEQEQDQKIPPTPQTRPPRSPPAADLGGGVVREVPSQAISERRFDVGTPAAEEARHAFVAAVADAIGDPTFVLTRDAKHIRALCDLLNAKAPRVGTHEAIRWIDPTVREWVTKTDPRFAAGWAPAKLLDWLNAGRPDSRASPASPRSISIAARRDLTNWEP